MSVVHAKQIAVYYCFIIRLSNNQYSHNEMMCTQIIVPLRFLMILIFMGCDNKY